jgi:hypothetical protein
MSAENIQMAELYARVSRTSVDECRLILRELLDVLYQSVEDPGLADPDKEWESDTLVFTGEIFSNHGLCPHQHRQPTTTSEGNPS